MGWLSLGVIAALAFAVIWRFGRLPRPALELAGAAIFLGVAGYAWQGSASLPESPAHFGEDMTPQDEAAIETRRKISGRFNGDAQWLDLADTMIRFGRTQEAVLAARSGLRDHRGSPELWVGLGNALVAHGEGIVSPAAKVAYERAAQISPIHPSPPFFYALALAREGKVDEAAVIWRRLLARTPTDAPWRKDIEDRLNEVTASRAQRGR